MSDPRQPLAVAVLLLLTGCAGPGTVATDPTAPPATDWIVVDRTLPRDPRRHLAHAFDDEASPQVAARRAAFGCEATVDSLGLNELASRPLPEQRHRRREAARMLTEAMVIIHDHAERLRADRGQAHTDSREFADLRTVLDQVLMRLHTAVGTDPEQAVAWAALAYFSTAVGDEEAATRARHAYLERAITADAAGRTRAARVVLDEAWALREAGRLPQCQRWLDAHRGLLDAAPPAHEALPPRLERDLIAALLAAEGGDRLGTRRRINRLPLVPIRQDGRDRDSTYLRTWVRAWLELSTGNPDAAARTIGPPAPIRLHTAVDWRFWQDVGRIAEACGQPDDAQQAWETALLNRPYPGFYALAIARGPDAFLGYPDTDAPYAIAYGTHRVGGSAWGFALTRALLCLDEASVHHHRRWQEAMTALDRCIARGHHQGAARLLRARLNLQRGNVAAAAADLQHPTVHRLAAGPLADEVTNLRHACRQE